jgi:hypothetical protein
MASNLSVEFSSTETSSVTSSVASSATGASSASADLGVSAGGMIVAVSRFALLVSCR